MTTVDVIFAYAGNPSEASILALSNVRQIYGIRRVELDERAHTIHVEYDATRLTEQTVAQLVRRTGIAMAELSPAVEPGELGQTSAVTP